MSIFHRHWIHGFRRPIIRTPDDDAIIQQTKLSCNYLDFLHEIKRINIYLYTNIRRHLYPRQPSGHQRL